MTLYPVSKCTPERAVDMVEMYGPERLLVNSAGDWGPSKPTAVPDFILAMRLRGHPESLIRRIVYDNPLEFFSQSRNFKFTPPELATAVGPVRPANRRDGNGLHCRRKRSADRKADCSTDSVGPGRLHVLPEQCRIAASHRACLTAGGLPIRRDALDSCRCQAVALMHARLRNSRSASMKHTLASLADCRSSFAVISSLGRRATAADEAGFKPIFNGRESRTAGTAIRSIWSVKDGAIVGETTTDNPTQGEHVS